MFPPLPPGGRCARVPFQSPRRDTAVVCAHPCATDESLTQSLVPFLIASGRLRQTIIFAEFTVNSKLAVSVRAGMTDLVAPASRRLSRGRLALGGWGQECTSLAGSCRLADDSFISLSSRPERSAASVVEGPASRRPRPGDANLCWHVDSHDGWLARNKSAPQTRRQPPGRQRYQDLAGIVQPGGNPIDGCSQRIIHAGRAGTGALAAQEFDLHQAHGINIRVA